MDTFPDWTTSTLFSPSKALAQQAQAKDWASVDAWLSRRYASKRLPSFERNEETLQALLTLATLNDSADEQRSLIDRVEKAAFQALLRRNASYTNDDVYATLMKALDGQEALDALASVAVALDCSDSDVGTIGTAIVELTQRKFEIEQQVQRADHQLRALKSEQNKVQTIMHDIKRDDFQPLPNLPELTADWVRNTKQLKAKITEYDERLNTLRANQQPTVRVEDFTQKVDDLAGQKARLDELNTDLAAFQSLPSDAKAARAKLETAREQLRGLVNQRDHLFEGLAEHG